MKLATCLFTVAAALAAPAIAADKDADRVHGRSGAHATQHEGKPGLGDRAKNAALRARDAMRRTGERMGERVERFDNRVVEPRIQRSANRGPDDTRAMGNRGMSETERARRDRMDEAYDNWRRQQRQ